MGPVPHSCKSREEHLRLLHELARRGTITAVAASLSYSPSSVSQQLAKLEEEVGAPLLERDGRRLRLTVQGRVVAQHAAKVIALEEKAAGKLQRSLPEVRGVVRLASLETTASALLPAVLADLEARHPRLRVEVAVVPPEVGLPELDTHRFDLAVAEQYPGHTRPQDEGVDRVVLGRDPIRLALPEEGTAQSIADVRDLPWVAEPLGTAARQWAVQQCRAAGFEPDVRYEATDLRTHIRLVAAGRAVSLLPDLVWAGSREPVRLIDLPGAPHRELFSSTRHSARARPAVQALRDALQRAWESASS